MLEVQGLEGQLYLVSRGRGSWLVPEGPTRFVVSPWHFRWLLHKVADTDCKSQASLSRAVVAGDLRICDLDSTCPQGHFRHFTSVEQALCKEGGLCTPLP